MNTMFIKNKENNPLIIILINEVFTWKNLKIQAFSLFLSLLL